MHDWILVEANLAEPSPGSVLDETGIRVRGTLGHVGPEVVEGVVRCDNVIGAEAETVAYLVTGSVLQADDFDVDFGSGPRHGGADVVLSVNGCLIQVQLEGWARDVTQGSHVRVRGELLVIPYYEWDDSGLVDTRGAWKVEQTRRLPGGDIALRLVPLLPSS
jgi:hypothetical protein